MAHEKEDSQQNMRDTIERIFPDVVPETKTWFNLCLLYIEGGVNALAELDQSFALSDKQGRSI
jgi:hypothetical protein